MACRVEHCPWDKDARNPIPALLLASHVPWAADKGVLPQFLLLENAHPCFIEGMRVKKQLAQCQGTLRTLVKAGIYGTCISTCT